MRYRRQDSSHYKRRSSGALQRVRVPQGDRAGYEKKGVNHAAKTAKLRDRAMIHAFERLPAKDNTSAAIGTRTSISDAASNEFLTTNAPASLMPLATKGS